MSDTDVKIKGLPLKARDEHGEDVQEFQVKWIGNLAFGVIDDYTTDKRLLELYVEEEQKNGNS